MYFFKDPLVFSTPGTDADECASRPCANSGTCLESSGSASVQPGRFACACTAHWRGTTCSQDVDECAVANGGCHALTRCSNRAGANATCGACPSGTRQGNANRTGAGGCVKIVYAKKCADPCLRARACPRPAVCTRTAACPGDGGAPRNWECNCPAGYRKAGGKGSRCLDVAPPTMACGADVSSGCSSFLRLDRASVRVGWPRAADNSGATPNVSGTAPDGRALKAGPSSPKPISRLGLC